MHFFLELGAGYKAVFFLQKKKKSLYTYAVCTFLYAYDKSMKIYIKIWKQSVARNKAKYISMVFYICVRGWPQI